MPANNKLVNESKNTKINPFSIKLFSGHEVIVGSKLMLTAFVIFFKQKTLYKLIDMKYFFVRQQQNLNRSICGHEITKKKRPSKLI